MPVVLLGVWLATANAPSPPSGYGEYMEAPFRLTVPLPPKWVVMRVSTSSSWHRCHDAGMTSEQRAWHWYQPLGTTAQWHADRRHRLAAWLQVRDSASRSRRRGRRSQSIRPDQMPALVVEAKPALGPALASTQSPRRTAVRGLRCRRRSARREPARWRRRRSCGRCAWLRRAHRRRGRADCRPCRPVGIRQCRC